MHNYTVYKIGLWYKITYLYITENKNKIQDAKSDTMKVGIFVKFLQIDQISDLNKIQAFAILHEQDLERFSIWPQII